MKKTLTVFITPVLLLGSCAVIVSAQDQNNPSGSDQNIQGSIPNPLKCPGGSADCSVIDYIYAIVEGLILPIGGVLAIIAFIWSGFMFVMAQGDPGKIKSARDALWYTAIGTAILLGSVALAKVIQTTVEALKTQ